jgi:RNA polymerase sigma-70 factor (ECF subfamily)
MSDHDELVQRCRQGELAAFTELFHAYQARVYRLAVAVLSDEREAEDVVQDVFVRVFERIGDFRGESAFTTWLTAIVVNRCRDKLRRRKVRQALSLNRLRGRASEDDVSELVTRRQQRQRLWALVDRLDDKHRMPVILHYHEGLPCGEVARILDLRVSTVYSRLNAARVRLRGMLREQAEIAGKEIGNGVCGKGLAKKEN